MKLLEIFDNANVHPGWEWVLQYAGKDALEKVDKEYTAAIERGEVIYPAPQQIFRVLETNPKDVKCIILGQDPYHGEGEATGLAFSVENGVKCPPSLRNIKKEIADDIGSLDLSGTDLSVWEQQGVFLMNTVWTVKKDTANSHAKWGWREFSGIILGSLALSGKGPLATILWGASAAKWRTTFQRAQAFRPVCVIESAHPSPLSANRGFFGSKPFSRTNEFLTEHGADPINWAIPKN